MRLAIPLTGTILTENPLSGDPNDPIRPVDIDLGNVSWRMLELNLDDEVMVIEVEPADNVPEPELDTQGRQKVDESGNPIYRKRKATEQEKLGFLQYARDLIFNHTKDELYKMGKNTKLRRPFKQ